MNTAAVFLVVASVIAVVVLFSIMPFVQTSIDATGGELSNATGYTVDDTESSTAISLIWGIAPVLVVLALFVMLLER